MNFRDPLSRQLISRRDWPRSAPPVHMDGDVLTSHVLSVLRRLPTSRRDFQSGSSSPALLPQFIDGSSAMSHLKWTLLPGDLQRMVQARLPQRLFPSRDEAKRLELRSELYAGESADIERFGSTIRAFVTRPYPEAVARPGWLGSRRGPGFARCRRTPVRGALQECSALR